MKSNLKTISEKAALKKIKSEDNLIIVHSKDGCPVCEYFIPEVFEPILKKWPDVKVFVIKEQLTFPVSAHPVIYLFKNGKCVQYPQGAAPEDKVIEMLTMYYGKPI